MDEMQNGLAGISDISDVGDVDLFGFDGFGNPVGMGAGWGALIGGGLSTAAAVGVRAFSKKPAWYKWSEAIGFGAGALAGGTMMIFAGTRHAGLAAIATALAVNGVRQVETMFGPSVSQAAWTVKEAKGDALAQLPTGTNPVALLTADEKAGLSPEVKAKFGLKGVEMYRQGVVSGLGIATMQPTGAVMSGNAPQLLGGTPEQHRKANAVLLGVPGLANPLSNMASAYGATIMGNS